MKLSISLVPVKKIVSNAARSQFSEGEIEKAARAILEAQGVINPLILQKRDFNTYEIVNGNFEYYAATRAKEIDLSRGETIGAFIIEPDNEESLKEQIDIFRNSQIAPFEKETSNKTNNLENRFNNFESRLETLILEIKTEQKNLQKDLEERLSSLNNKMSEPKTPLAIFNHLELTKLVFRLKTAGIGDKKALQIAENIVREREKDEFKSLSDVVARVKISQGKKSIKAISDAKMLQILDTWSQIAFNRS
jgi:hypothetical protein